MPLDELRHLLARHARPDLRTAIDDVLIIRADRPYPPRPTTYGRVLAVMVQGIKRLALGEHVYDYRAGEYVVASVDLPVSSHFTDASPYRPGLGVGVNLDPAAVADLLLSAPGGLPELPGGGTEPAAGLTVSTAPTELLDALLRLVRLLDQPRDIPVLAPLVKREILWRLLTGEQGAMVRQLGLPDSNVSHIARAVRWIRDNYARGFLVEEAARQAGMSVSAFHRNFQAVTAMTPIQFQKQIRLQHARLQLAADGADGVDVTTVSRRVGYGSLSQFSREYRRQFGVAPREDAARLRTAESVGFS